MSTTPTTGNSTPTRKGPGYAIPSSKRGIKGFYQETLLEMKKVTWPTRPEAWRLTGVVLTVCIGAVALLYSMSVVFDTLLGVLVRGK